MSTFKTFALITALSVSASAPASADVIDMPWTNQSNPAVSVPADFGAHRSDGIVLQIALVNCGQHQPCVQQVWNNQFVASCRDHDAGDVACFGASGAVVVAAISTATASNQGCPIGTHRAEGFGGPMCLDGPDVIVD